MNHLPDSLLCTCAYGLRSWSQLDDVERRNWASCVGKLKGFDFRDKETQCSSINDLAKRKIRFQRWDALGDKGKRAKSLRELREIINADLAANPPTTEELETAIGCAAVEAHRQGYLLLAVAPDLRSDNAASLMEKVYGSTRRLLGVPPKQRARLEAEWLKHISQFEDEEVSCDAAYAQTFARYRRAVDGIRFN